VHLGLALPDVLPMSPLDGPKRIFVVTVVSSGSIAGTATVSARSPLERAADDPMLAKN
jgi:hypothetical protein